MIVWTFQSGLTPLHVASFMGHTAIVTYLLENGAETETATMRGETALHLAARANQIEVMRILIRARANVDAKAKVSSLLLFVFHVFILFWRWLIIFRYIRYVIIWPTMSVVIEWIVCVTVCLENLEIWGTFLFLAVGFQYFSYWWRKVCKKVGL